MSDTKRVTPQAVFDVAPGLGYFNETALFGMVWKDERLSARDRSLVCIAILVTTGRVVPHLEFHTRRALDNGLTPVEIGEILTHLAFYAGWPSAMSAVYEVEKAFRSRGIGPLDDGDGSLLDLEPEAEKSRLAIIAANVAPTAPGLADDTDNVVFAQLWRRPQLTPRDRSLATVAALIASGQVEQIGYHLGRAIDNGLTAEQAGEMLRHAAYYAGWPRAMSAVGPLKQALLR